VCCADLQRVDFGAGNGAGEGSAVKQIVIEIMRLCTYNKKLRDTAESGSASEDLQKA
jgi:hypothetical protein